MVTNLICRVFTAIFKSHQIPVKQQQNFIFVMSTQCLTHQRRIKIKMWFVSYHTAGNSDKITNKTLWIMLKLMTIDRWPPNKTVECSPREQNELTLASQTDRESCLTALNPGEPDTVRPKLTINLSYGYKTWYISFLWPKSMHINMEDVTAPKK